MEKLSECKRKLHRAYFHSKKGKKKEKSEKHAMLGAILKVTGSFGGLGEKGFYFPAVSQESIM